MADTRDPRTIRLFDLAAHEAVIVTCQCGRISEYRQGMLQRVHRIPSDTLLYDLQFRLRCSHCQRRDDFKIELQDTRFVGTSSHLPEPRVIVEPKKE
jgi:hypothetical protein